MAVVKAIDPSNVQFVTQIQQFESTGRVIKGEMIGGRLKKDFSIFAKEHYNIKQAIRVAPNPYTNGTWLMLEDIPNDALVQFVFDESWTKTASMTVSCDQPRFVKNYEAVWSKSNEFTFAGYLYKKYIVDQFGSAIDVSDDMSSTNYTVHVDTADACSSLGELSNAFKDFGNKCSTWTTTTTGDSPWITYGSGTGTSIKSPWVYDAPGVQKGTLVLNGRDIGDEFEKANPVEKGNNKMTANMVNFDFGPVRGENVHISMYGVAIRNKDGRWVAYDKSNADIVDVEIFNFSGGNLMYKMPVGVDKVSEGDVIVHGKVPMIVLHVNFNDNGKVTSFTAVDPYAGEQKTILPTKNMFNLNFVTKIVSLMDSCGGLEANESNPFGNVLPLMMMSGENGDIDPMALMLMMNGSNTQMDSNMLLMLALSGKNTANELLPMMMLMNNNR